MFQLITQCNLNQVLIQELCVQCTSGKAINAPSNSSKLADKHVLSLLMKATTQKGVAGRLSNVARIQTTELLEARSLQT